jgi:hypothetical protein
MNQLLYRDPTPPVGVSRPGGLLISSRRLLATALTTIPFCLTRSLGATAEIFGNLIVAGNGPEHVTIEALARAFERANPLASIDVLKDPRPQGKRSSETSTSRCRVANPSAKEAVMRPWRSCSFSLFFVISLMLTLSPARSLLAEEGTIVEGAGFSLFNTESIKGFDQEKVEKDPVCDPGKRPRIVKVEPDDVKPGDKVVISGENFGTKECFRTVTFSASPEAKVTYQFVNDSTIEAIVPEASAGMSFLIIVTGSGSAQSKPLLIHPK